MDIQREPAEKHAIQSYSEHEITVQGIKYTTSTLMTALSIITDWNVHTIQNLTTEHFTPILTIPPELIIIGHAELGKYPPPTVIQFFYTKRIGIECMSVGAACRTFNVLLSENRQVVLGFISMVQGKNV